LVRVTADPRATGLEQQVTLLPVAKEVSLMTTRAEKFRMSVQIGSISVKNAKDEREIRLT